MAAAHALATIAVKRGSGFVTEQVAVELVLAGLIDGASGEHVGDPGVVERVVIDDAREGTGAAVPARKARRHGHLPLVVSNLLHDVVERVIGEDEDIFLVHRNLLCVDVAVSQSTHPATERTRIGRSSDRTVTG